jgi:hypothetical protein
LDWSGSTDSIDCNGSSDRVLVAPVAGEYQQWQQLQHKLRITAASHTARQQQQSCSNLWLE